ncbi:MAG: hypothetical protein WCK08_10485, partial [Betaproteobacteria bacterium]
MAADRQDIQSLTEAYSAQQSSTTLVSVPLLSRLLSNPAAISAAQTFAVDATLFDIGQLSLQSGLVGGALRVAGNEVLGGSGAFYGDLTVEGLLSPGYSPG